MAKILFHPVPVVLTSVACAIYAMGVLAGYDIAQTPSAKALSALFLVSAILALLTGESTDG